VNSSLQHSSIAEDLLYNFYLCVVLDKNYPYSFWSKVEIKPTYISYIDFIISHAQSFK